MTSTADTDEQTDEHPEITEISALSEGILQPDRSADLRGHLAACALCAEVHDCLDGVRHILGTLPGQLMMPDDVAERIDAALAAETLIDATIASTPDAQAAWVPPPLPPVSRETSARETSTQPSGRAATATGSGRPRHQQWGLLLAIACTAAALGAGSVYIRSLVSTGTPHPPVTGEAHVPGTLSGTALSTRVHELLAVANPAGAPRTGAPAENTPMSTDAGSTSVPSCVLQGTGRTDPPLGSTQGTYSGRAAYLIVLPHPADSSRVDAFVVDASCASASTPPAGRVMTQVTYNR